MNYHIGTHEEAISGLLHANAGRYGWLRRVVQHLARTVAGPARDRAEEGEARGDRDAAETIIVVLVYCAHGKHRSVGLAYLLCQAIQLCGFATELRHRSEPNWSRYRCTNDGRLCRSCDTSNISANRHHQLIAWRNAAMLEIDAIDG